MRLESSTSWPSALRRRRGRARFAAASHRVRQEMYLQSARCPKSLSARVRLSLMHRSALIRRGRVLSSSNEYSFTALLFTVLNQLVSTVSSFDFGRAFPLMGGGRHFCAVYYPGVL